VGDVDMSEDATEKVTPSAIGEKEKIQILLAEYSTLRTEVLQRNTVMNQFFAVSITASIAVIGIVVAYAAHGAALVVTLLLAALISFIGYLISFDTRRIALYAA
jgi:hypothetical protein